jgi:hypothetical protein
LRVSAENHPSQPVEKRGFRQCDDAGLEVNEISQVAAGPQPEPASSAPSVRRSHVS